jgi:hypothetical protein
MRPLRRSGTFDRIIENVRQVADAVPSPSAATSTNRRCLPGAADFLKEQSSPASCQ